VVKDFPEEREIVITDDLMDDSSAYFLDIPEKAQL
jgi:hypothetical protein